MTLNTSTRSASMVYSVGEATNQRSTHAGLDLRPRTWRSGNSVERAHDFLCEAEPYINLSLLEIPSRDLHDLRPRAERQQQLHTHSFACR